MKTCSKCGIEKPLTKDYFYRQAGCRDGFRPDCKACVIAQHKVYVSSVAEKVKEYKKAYRAKNKDLIKREYDQWVAKNREYVAAKSAEWKARNIDIVRASRIVSEGKRRARKRGAGGQFTPRQALAIRKHQRNRCAYCKARLGKNAHLDHIVPLARGGAHATSNVQWLCEPCNLTKGAKDPVDFAQSVGLLL